MAPGVASGQPLPQPEASHSYCTLQPNLPSPPSSTGWAEEKPLGRSSKPAGSSVKVVGARGPGHPTGEGTPTAGPGERRRCTGRAPACPEAPPVSWGLGARRLSARTPGAPPHPGGLAGPGVSPHGAIGPTADVRGGHVDLGQLPGGPVDVLLVEALFPGEAHPANPISVVPARRLRSRSAGLPTPGPARGRVRSRPVPVAPPPREGGPARSASHLPARPGAPRGPARACLDSLCPEPRVSARIAAGLKWLQVRCPAGPGASRPRAGAGAEA